MTAFLIWVAVAAWLFVLAFMTPAVWAIYVRQSRRGDPARLVCFSFGLLMVGFLSRRIVISDMSGDWLYNGLLIASLAVAGLTLFTARTYGRGGRV